MTRNFDPKPIDVSNIELDGEFLVLSEILAENSHEVWAAERIAQGWEYGETRDDNAKRTPFLVPYAELSESEKGYDRSTSMDTLKLLKKLGYKIINVNK